MGKKDNEVPDIEIDDALFHNMLKGFKLMPEQTFLLAFLQRAILDYVGPAATLMHYHRSARGFFTSDSREVMSFNWVADHLPWDGDWFKAVIFRYINERLAERAVKDQDDLLYHIGEA